MSYVCKRITKPKSSAWNYFQEVSECDEKNGNSLVSKYQCVFCGARYAAHATRLTRHLSRGCRECPRSVAAEFSNSSSHSVGEDCRPLKSTTSLICDSFEDDKNEFDDSSGIDETFAEHTPFQHPSKSISNTSLSSSSSQFQDTAESLYARALYSGGLSLNFNDNEYWRKFLNHLNSEFKIPTKSKLIDQLLSCEFSFIESYVNKKIEESPVLCLQCLVSNDERNCSTLNFIINVPEPLFYKSVVISCGSDMNIFLQNEVELIMDNFGCDKFVAVSTNSDSLLEFFDQKILSLTAPIQYNCPINSLNLFLEDILQMETASSLLINLFDIVEELRKEIPELFSTLTLPLNDSCKSVCMCLRSIFENEKMSTFLAPSEENYATEHIEEVFSASIDYWSKMKKLYFIIEPVLITLNRLATNDVCISSVFDYFHEIEICIESTAHELFCANEVEKIRLLLSHYRKTAISPLHLSANILDPKSNGSKLTDDEQILGSEFIDKLSGIMYKNDRKAVGEVLCDLAKYRCRKGVFNASYVLKTAKHLSPEIWWKGSCYGLKLSNVAHFILSLPAASTAKFKNLLIFNEAELENQDLDAEQIKNYLFVHKNLSSIHPNLFLCSVENSHDCVNEEFENPNEKLISEENISEIEYEITYKDYCS